MKYIIVAQIDLHDDNICLALLDQEKNFIRPLNEAVLKARMRLKRDPMAKVILLNGDISWFSFSLQDNESMKVINKLNWDVLKNASIELF